MAVRLTDSEIQKLIVEEKLLPDDYRTKLKNFRQMRSSKESKIEAKGKSGCTFNLIMRQSNRNPFDFSVILSYEIPKTTATFRLRRYNGKHSLHSNRIEKNQFINVFHIHQATQRYQEKGADEDSYAEKSDRYNTIWEALDCMIQDCNFKRPESETNQMSMKLNS